MIATVLDGIKNILELNGFPVIERGDITGNKQASRIALREINRLPLDGEIRNIALVEVYCFAPIKPTDRFESLKIAGEQVETLINALWNIDNVNYAVMQEITASDMEDDGRVLQIRLTLKIMYRG